MILNRSKLEGVEMNAETPDDFFPRAKMVTRNQFADDGVIIAGLPENMFAKAPTRIVSTVKPRYQADESKQIFVKSNFNPTNDGGGKVVFTERNEAHPSREAFVSNAVPTKIALTLAAVEALNTGQILECSSDEVDSFTAKKFSDARRQLNIQKEIHRRKFAALIGNDFGFEKAWSESIRGREALNIVETVL
jgi:hypothetical protein